MDAASSAPRGPWARNDGATGERAATDALARLLPSAPPGEVYAGDDTAWVTTCDSRTGKLLLCCDVVVDQVHFDLELCSPSDVGWKALAATVSDVAAMGGRPLHCLVSVVGATQDVLDGLYDGLLQAAQEYRCAIVGGDLSAGSELTVAVTVTGTLTDPDAPDAASLGPVLRSGARPGDQLFVTGPLGASAAGLRTLTAAASAGRLGPSREAAAVPLGVAREPVAELSASVPTAPAGALADAYRRPRARVEEGAAARRGGARAMIDVSDGFGLDLDRLARASGIGVVVDEIPAAAGASPDEALGGGEDYELLFAAPDGDRVIRVFAAAGCREPIGVGTCVEDPEVRRLGDGPLAPRGWEHALRPTVGEWSARAERPSIR